MKRIASEWRMCLAALFSVATFGLVCAFLGLLFLEKPSIEYKNIPFPSPRTVIAQGQIVPLIINSCNNTDKPVNYSTTHALKRVQSGLTFYTVLPQVQIIAPPGCTFATTAINTLPLDLEPGRYILFGTAEVRGALRVHYVDWHSEEFDVVAVKIK
jgi:hypothetical protein